MATPRISPVWSRLAPRHWGVLTTALLLLLASPSWSQTQFMRGDCNGDGQVDIADPISLLSTLFPIGTPPVPDCLDACDANDDEKLDIADPITSLAYIFGSGADLPSPFLNCGLDTTLPPLCPDLGCISYLNCSGVVDRPDPPTISPHADLISSTMITISGTAVGADFVEVITSNAMVFATPVTGGSWTMTDIPLLQDAQNTLFFASLAGTNRSAIITTQVTVDTQPPTLNVVFPPDGFQTANASLTVYGNVLDSLSGHLGIDVDVVTASSTSVLPGTSPSSFLANDVVLLGVGLNTLTVQALDAAGNLASVDIVVERLAPDPNLPTLEPLPGGLLQTGPVSEELPLPLEVLVLDQNGVPITNQPVQFAVTAGTGGISPTSGTFHMPTQTVLTDINGIAGVFWLLGVDAGVSGQRVEAVSAGIQGSAIFVANGTAAPGQRLVKSRGDLQIGETESELLEELEVLVYDEFDNPAGPGIDVTFQIVVGDGQFAGAATNVVVQTGADSRARVALQLGAIGNHAVTATFPGNVGLPVLFTARAVERDPIAATRFVGQVLEGSREPLRNATLTLCLDNNIFTTVSDVDGNFAFNGLPIAGAAILHADGTTVDQVGGVNISAISPWSYPQLEYTVLVVPQTTMELPFPIFMPRIQPSNASQYSTANGATLTIQQLPGLELNIRPGSMFLGGNPAPDGTPVSINLVQTDSVPMVPTDGASPGATFTLQPGSATFDPPAQLCYPNVSALQPGRRVQFHSFDHHTNRFEVVGFGQVDSEGAFVKSDVGSGLPSGGWHYFFPPSGPIARITGDSTLNLPAGCTVQVGTASVQTNSDGSFQLDYRVQDTTNGDSICVVIECEGPGGSQFWTSATFIVIQGNTYPVQTLTSLPARPVEPSMLTELVGPALVPMIGDQIQLQVGATIGGFAFDYTAHPKTAYRSSNPAIASVDANGLVTGHANGTVIITIRNTGAVTTTIVVVGESSTVTGSVEDSLGNSVVGATVRVQAGGVSLQTISDLSGNFEVSGIGPDLLSVLVSASAPSGGGVTADALVNVSPGATVDVGVLTLSDPMVRFKALPATVPSGGIAQVLVHLDNTVADCSGYSYGLCFDTNELSFSQANDLVQPGGQSPALFVPSAIPSQGVTIGCVFDTFGTFFLPTGLDELLTQWSLSAIGTPATTQELSVDFCEIGSPPVPILIATSTGSAASGSSVSTTVTVVP